MVVFKTPADNRTDYIKRLIGMPGDKIQFVDGNLIINDKKLKKTIAKYHKIRCGNFILETDAFVETLPNGVEYLTVYKKRVTSKFYGIQSSRKSLFFIRR